MNIIFFGSSHFGLPSLKALIAAGHKISCVVTQPDRKKGRGQKITRTEIKEFAQENKIPVFQPVKINDQENIIFLEKLKPDIFVVIAYGQILSREVLSVAKIISVNVHASLLPYLRGAAPINWAIINGLKQTGISIIKMTEKMDAGPIISQANIDILPDDDFVSLENKLSLLSGDTLPGIIQAIEINNFTFTPQEEKKASLAPKLKKENGLINWKTTNIQILNLIRGLSGWPGAFTYYNGKLLKIIKTEATKSPSHQVTKTPGEIISVSKEGITVATGEGNILITSLQPEAKRQMSAQEFIVGHKISCSDTFKNKK